MTKKLAAPSMSLVPWLGDYGPRLGERADGGGMLPDVSSEASTAIYTEGISPLDTWRSGSSEVRSVSDFQDLAVSLPFRGPFSAPPRQVEWLTRAFVLGREYTRRGGRCNGHWTAQTT